MNWAEFFAMGGYGAYVWGAYAIAAVVLLLNLFIPLRRGQAVRSALREFYRLKGQTK